MPNLENLISKILSDCEEKARQIVESAEEKASEIKRVFISEAENEKERILSEAKFEAAQIAEQITLSKKLEIRDDILDAKRVIIDKVFDHALQKLNNMPKDEFKDFLCKTLLQLDLDGEEIILPSKYEFTDIDWLNEFLSKSNKKGNLRLHKTESKIEGGFALLNEGIENNNTFEKLIQFYRYELESGISSGLFNQVVS